MSEKEALIGKHGGYRRLKTFQLARLIYDVTVRFCQLYVDARSRTRDQMIQAARSGVQNIAEGSQASAASKKTEIKLTAVARASLEELRLDYEDFLRQRTLPILPTEDSILKRFKARKCSTLEQVQNWIQEERRKSKQVSSAGLAANAALSLINLTAYLLNRQLARQAETFENEGGFTERLYRVRSKARDVKS
jgi:four helix bundle suffix protein